MRRVPAHGRGWRRRTAGREPRIWLQPHLVVDRQRRVVAEARVLVDGGLASSLRDAARGQVVVEAAKNPQKAQSGSQESREPPEAMRVP